MGVLGMIEKEMAGLDSAAVDREGSGAEANIVHVHDLPEVLALAVSPDGSDDVAAGGGEGLVKCEGARWI